MHTTRFAFILALSMPFSVAMAEDVTLLQIMQDLGRQNAELADAILAEDWELMASVAAAIADHPKPAMGERMQILGALGSRAGEFRGLDTKVHNAAVRIRDAAAVRDIVAANKSYLEMFDACVACHVKFRDEVRTLRIGSTSEAARIDTEPDE